MGQSLSIEDFEDFQSIGSNKLIKDEYEIMIKIHKFTYMFAIISFSIIFLYLIFNI